VTRICTERPEAVESGTSVLVGADFGEITRCIDRFLRYGHQGRRMKNPFGDGMAAERIVDTIIKGHCDEFKG